MPVNDFFQFLLIIFLVHNSFLVYYPFPYLKICFIFQRAFFGYFREGIKNIFYFPINYFFLNPNIPNRLVLQSAFHLKISKDDKLQ